MEIAVPYRLYMPRKFFHEYSILVTVKPMDHRGGYLFAVVNAYDSAVDLGLLIEAAGEHFSNNSERFWYLTCEIWNPKRIMTKYGNGIVPYY